MLIQGVLPIAHVYMYIRILCICMYIRLLISFIKSEAEGRAWAGVPNSQSTPHQL